MRKYVSWLFAIGAAVSACASGGTTQARSGSVATAAAPAGESGTLIVANMADNTANIIDVASRSTINIVPTGAGPHEVAVSHDGRWAVVSNYGIRGAPGNSLTVIDVTTDVVVPSPRLCELALMRKPK